MKIGIQEIKSIDNRTFAIAKNGAIYEILVVDDNRGNVKLKLEEMKVEVVSQGSIDNYKKIKSDD